MKSMNVIKKKAMWFLLLAMFVAPCLLRAQDSGTLSKEEVKTLIANARTPEQHERLAQYYQAKAQDYLGQAKEHEAMVAAYKANTTLSNDKNHASTISHCEYFVTTFKALADNSQDLAALHERMAKDAPTKLAPVGK